MDFYWNQQTLEVSCRCIYIIFPRTRIKINCLRRSRVKSMICTENEMCTWPSDSCITVLRVKSSDYKCRKKEWNELKKLSIHGDAVQRGLASSFVNLVSIEEKCNGDQLDVYAVPISPWEQDSVTSLSLCSDDGWSAPHRSLSSTQIELDSNHSGLEKCCKLVLKKSTSSPSLFDKKPSTESQVRLTDEELSDALNNNSAHRSVRPYGPETLPGRTSTLPDDHGHDGDDCVALLPTLEQENVAVDRCDNQPTNENSDLLNERDESSSTLSPVFLLIRSCFPFLFRSRVLRN